MLRNVFRRRLRGVAVQLTVVLALVVACGRPIELVDEGVVTLTATLPFPLEDLSVEARSTLRVTAELVGHASQNSAGDRR